jgi:hypothetical protein
VGVEAGYKTAMPLRTTILKYSCKCGQGGHITRTNFFREKATGHKDKEEEIFSIQKYEL